MAPKLLLPSVVKDGHLSPWEIAKAIAYRNVLQDMSLHIGAPVLEQEGVASSYRRRHLGTEPDTVLYLRGVPLESSAHADHEQLGLQ